MPKFNTVHTEHQAPGALPAEQSVTVGPKSRAGHVTPPGGGGGGGLEHGGGVPDHATDVASPGKSCYSMNKRSKTILAIDILWLAVIAKTGYLCDKIGHNEATRAATENRRLRQIWLLLNIYKSEAQRHMKLLVLIDTIYLHIRNLRKRTTSTY